MGYETWKRLGDKMEKGEEGVRGQRRTEGRGSEESSDKGGGKAEKKKEQSTRGKIMQTDYEQEDEEKEEEEVGGLRVRWGEDEGEWKEGGQEHWTGVEKEEQDEGKKGWRSCFSPPLTFYYYKWEVTWLQTMITMSEMLRWTWLQTRWRTTTTMVIRIQKLCGDNRQKWFFPTLNRKKKVIANAFFTAEMGVIFGTAKMPCSTFIL